MLKSIELFTGVGGLALGVSEAGFEHIALVEYNKNACESIRKNWEHFGPVAKSLPVLDVAAVDFSSHLGGVDLLAAGAPCQPFSIGGLHRAHADDRNLFPQVFRAQREMLPKAVVVENVRGLLRASLSEFVEFIELQLAMPHVLPRDPLDASAWQKHLPALRRAAKQGRAMGEVRYHVSRSLLQAADYGVPQRRERVFFVALREDVSDRWAVPAPTHSEEMLFEAQWVTGAYWRSHGLRVKRRTSVAHVSVPSSSVMPTLPWRTVRDALSELPKPNPRREHPDWLNHVGQPGARVYPGHTGSALDAPAKTLKAGVHGVPGGENMLRHPNGRVRYFTVREAARLQTFPDQYDVAGAWGEAMRQLGNAVPVQLARVVAKSVADLLGAPSALEPQRR